MDLTTWAAKRRRREHICIDDDHVANTLPTLTFADVHEPGERVGRHEQS